MRVLLLGTTGQVGWELHRALQPLGDIVALSRREADFADPESLRSAFGERFDVVVNAVAHTAVDAAETAIDEATRINVDAVRVLADECARSGAMFVHYSTDYVFDGTGDRPYREDDATGPQSVYGRTKLAGEQAIAASGCDHLVFRTSWVYASRGRNFVRTMLRLAKDRETLKVVADQFGAPTSARLIADTTAQALHVAADERMAGRFASGVFHLVASGRTSWHGLASRVVERGRARMPGADAWPVREVLPIPASDYPVPAKRPSNSSLDTSRLCARFGVTMPDWTVGLDLVVDELADLRREECA